MDFGWRPRRDFELETIKNVNDVDEPDVIDISKLKNVDRGMTLSRKVAWLLFNSRKNRNGSGQRQVWGVGRDVALTEFLKDTLSPSFLIGRPLLGSGSVSVILTSLNSPTFSRL